MIEMPLPPAELAAYVAVCSGGDPVTLYLEQGAAFARILRTLFPPDLDLDGGRVLDFGCGSGRLLRHLINAGTGASFEGADIDAACVEWLERHLPPPHVVFRSEPSPPLPRPDGHYRLIYATSVFTHLTDTWSAWMCELHRLLSDGGILIVTVISEAIAAAFDEDPWDEQRIGMLVLGPGRPWVAGGPMVLHSEWWLRAHWGRAFEILDFDGGQHSGFGQGVVVMRKRAVAITPGALERPEAGEPRELTALAHALRRSHQESVALNTGHDQYSLAYQHEVARRQELQGQNDALGQRLQETAAQLEQARRARSAARIILRALRGRTRMLWPGARR